MTAGWWSGRGYDRRATSWKSSAVPRKVAVLLFKFSGDPVEPWSPEQTRSKVFTASDSANAFYEEESYGQISLTGKLSSDGDVFGWFTLDTSPGGCPYDTWRSRGKPGGRRRRDQPHGLSAHRLHLLSAAEQLLFGVVWLIDILGR